MKPDTNEQDPCEYPESERNVRILSFAIVMHGIFHRGIFEVFYGHKGIALNIMVVGFFDCFLNK